MKHIFFKCFCLLGVLLCIPICVCTNSCEILEAAFIFSGICLIGCIIPSRMLDFSYWEDTKETHKNSIPAKKQNAA